jgi:mannose-6-phosphate isomerase-like protein (cupin superfamily)
VLSERNERPWGYYQVVDEGEGWQVKRICIHAGHRLSYQRHAYRSEHWYVVAGVGVATIDDVEFPVRQGSIVKIAIGTAHRVANPASGDAAASEDLLLIEVQTGSYFGEDDIERLSDDYARTDSSSIS